MDFSRYHLFDQYVIRFILSIVCFASFTWLRAESSLASWNEPVIAVSQDEYDLSCGLAHEVHAPFSEGTPKNKGRYFSQHTFDVFEKCQYVVEIVSGDFAPIMTMSADQFIDIVRNYARPLVKGPAITWGDPATRHRETAFMPQTFDPGYLEAIVFAMVNEARQKEGLPPFRYSEALNQSARLHSEEMGALNYFSHDSPIAENATSNLRIHQNFKFPGRRYAENIGQQKFTGEAGFQDLDYEALAQGVMQNGLNSAGHRRQIMRTDLFYLGVGCALVVEGGCIEFYYTQNFGGE